MIFLAFSIKTSKNFPALVEKETYGCHESTLDEKLLTTPGNNSTAFKQVVNIY